MIALKCKNMTPLSIKLIDSYGFEKRITKPDWDDVQNEYTLPNGLELTSLVVCCNQPTAGDSLEGLDGYIYINTKEELDDLLSKTYTEILREIESTEPDFEINDYLDE